MHNKWLELADYDGDEMAAVDLLTVTAKDRRIVGCC